MFILDGNTSNQNTSTTNIRMVVIKCCWCTNAKNGDYHFHKSNGLSLNSAGGGGCPLAG